MPTVGNPSLLEVDWSKIPPPVDDGAARHLEGMTILDVSLPSTDRTSVSLAKLTGRVVVFAYPRTGRPGEPALVDDWDQILGARGCTPQVCGFRDLHRALLTAGASHVFGLSAQSMDYQREAAVRLHLPFAILSDEKLPLTRALNLPTFEVAGMTLLKCVAMIIDGGRIAKVSILCSAGRERARCARLACTRVNLPSHAEHDLYLRP